MTTLHDALRQAISTASECDPRELGPSELAMLDQLDVRAFQIMDRLIAEHDECGPEARACILKARAAAHHTQAPRYDARRVGREPDPAA